MPRKKIKFKVSRLTKPWALPGVEADIRALWGEESNKFDIELEINKEPRKKK